MATTHTMKKDKKICLSLKSIKKSFFIFSNIITNKNKIETAPAYTIIKTIEKNSIEEKNKVDDKKITNKINNNNTIIGDEKYTKK
jgi:hypothetical protein